MIIAIDLTSLSWHLTGIERYAMCVTEKMLELDRENSYILFFRNSVCPLFEDKIDGGRIQARVLHGENKLMFLQITLANALRRSKADKYIFFAFPGPLLFRQNGILNTIHDMGAWDSAEEMTTLSRLYFRLSYRFAARISETIITVSKFSKGRINCILRVPEDRIRVIHSAVYDGMLGTDQCTFENIKGKFGLPDRYILTLSTLEPRKNMRLLLRAFDRVADRVNYDLVLVGRKGWKIDDVLNEYGAREKIHMTGFVEDEYLAAIYKNALCFVFPSLYEGFGLPPVEALSLGVPVVSSDAASLPEVLMDRATYFKSDSAEDLEKILLELDDRVEEMPRALNDYQKRTYSFMNAARKVLSLIKGEWKDE